MTLIRQIKPDEWAVLKQVRLAARRGPQGRARIADHAGIVISGFQDVANYSDEMVESFHEKFGPLPTCDDIANTMHYVVSQPPHVNISDICVRATRQDYP